MVIDSANMQCDACGVTANRPVLLMPDGWIVDSSTKPIKHFCSICSININLREKSTMNRRSTDYQVIPAVADINYTAMCSFVEVNNDPVNHPTHMSFCLGNAIKYIWRADSKSDSIQDLEKARWYINREIQRRKNNAYLHD